MNKENQIEQIARVIDELLVEKPKETTKHAINVATYLFDRGYRKQEWISVEDRLPEESVDVLVVVKIRDRISVDTDRIYVGRWFNYGKFGHLQGYVTHWMPLPEPPKMKGGE